MNYMYAYSVNEEQDGWYVSMSDLTGNSRDVCKCNTEKVAVEVCEHFDRLAISEERDLFEIGDENLMCSCDDNTWSEDGDYCDGCGGLYHE